MIRFAFIGKLFRRRCIERLKSTYPLMLIKIDQYILECEKEEGWQFWPENFETEEDAIEAFHMYAINAGWI